MGSYAAGAAVGSREAGVVGGTGRPFLLQQQGGSREAGTTARGRSEVRPFDYQATHLTTRPLDSVAVSMQMIQHRWWCDECHHRLLLLCMGVGKVVVLLA